MQKPVWKAVLTRMSAQKLLSSVPESLMYVGTLISRNIRNSGISSACCGSRLAARKTPSSVMLNLKENRASTNAMHDDRNRVKNTAGTVIQIVLMKWVVKSACSHASR